MAVVGWIDPATVDEYWADAPAEGIVLTTILTAAHEQCAAYAPAQPVDSETGQPLVPESWRLAQVLQAKHLSTRSKAGDSAGFGPDGFMVQTFPLVMEARSLLRPKRSPLKGLL